MIFNEDSSSSISSKIDIYNLNANENFSVDLNFKKAVTLQYFLRFLAIHKQLGRGEKGQGGGVRWGLLPQG